MFFTNIISKVSDCRTPLQVKGRLMMFIKAFTQIDLNNLQEVGGKGSNLGEMAQAGLPVPPGYCITSKAYSYFINQAEINDLLKLLEDTTVADHEKIVLVSSEISKRIFETPVPEGLKNDIIDAFKEIIGDEMVVAVRSSATAEDLPEASFAGQQESYLNISMQELISYVKKCWASLWTERAIYYRINNGFDHKKVFLAVVVQQMVNSEVSGVAFSVNPLNSNANEIIIEAVWGLGEGLVSGQITPDHFVINKQNNTIIRYEISDKEKRVVCLSNRSGTIFDGVAVDQCRKSTLSKKDILELTRRIKQIEEHYQFPQDIEWAKVGDSYYILQTRPITTLNKLANKVEEQKWEREFFNFNPEFEWTNLGGIKERYNTPISTLGWSLIEPCQTVGGLFAYRAIGYKELSSPVFIANIYGYLYINFTNLKEIQPLKMLEAYSSTPDWQQFKPNRTKLEEFFLTIRSLKAGNKLVQSLDKSYYSMLPKYLTELKKHKKIEVKKLTSLELLSYIRDILDLAKAYFQLQLSSVSVAEALYNMLISLMKKWIGDEDLSLSSRLVSGLPGNLTVQTNNEIWNLTEVIESSPHLRKELLQTTIPEFLRGLDYSPDGKVFKDKLTNFLLDYGHLNVNMDIAQDFWWENPGIILSMVKGSLTAEKRINPLDREKQKQHEREKTEILVRSKLNILQRAIFNKILKETQTYMLLRDNRHFYVTMPFSLIKKGVVTLAERLSEQGYLVDSEDIYYLTLKELEELLRQKMTWSQGHEKINARKAAPKVRLDDLPSLFKGWPSLLEETSNIQIKSAKLEENRQDIFLRGVSGSPGQVHGQVKIITSPADFSQFQASDILVAVNTDPAWTPLFSIASAVVTEYGGLLSHGAIVAREYGIPAVLGVKNATKILKDRQRITVDGYKGVIHLYYEQMN